MGNGTKVALVALLILMVVVVARFVKDDTEVAKGEGNPDTGTGVTPERPKTGGTATPRGQRDPRLSQTRQTLQDRQRQQREAAERAARMRSEERERPPTRPFRRLLPQRPKPVDYATAPGFPPSRRSERRGSSGGSFQKLSPQSATSEKSALVTTRLQTEQASSGKTTQEAEAPTTEAKTPVSVAGEKNNETGGATQVAVADDKSRLKSRNPGTLPKSGLSADAEKPTVRTFGALAVEERGETPESTNPTVPAKRSFPLKHVLVKGDSPWALAERYYGKGWMHGFIENANPGKFQAGKEITIPAPPKQTTASKPKTVQTTTNASTRKSSSGSKATAAASGLKPTGRGYSTYTVRKGDTLGGLARRFYKKSTKAYILEEANPDLKYMILRAGEVIKVPDPQ